MNGGRPEHGGTANTTMRPFGLRPRLVAAQVGIAIVTITITALILIPPLEGRLRHNELSRLRATAIGARRSFSTLDEASLRPNSLALRRRVEALERQSGARVAVVDRRGRLLARTLSAGATERSVAAAAIGAPHPIAVAPADTEQARVGFQFTADEQEAGVGLVRTLDSAASATDETLRSFLAAALISLIPGTLLGLWLSGGLTRRLSVLRRSALAVADAGPRVELVAQDGTDEIADLSRAFATMQSKLNALERSRTRFVSMASHELRTPVTSLRLTIELLREDLESKPTDLESARAAAMRAEAQAERLGSLASDLLDLSRLDADVPLRSVPVELIGVCRGVAAEFDAAGRPTIEIRGEGRCWGLGDPDGCARIVRLLIDNARRHGGSEEPIEVDFTAGPHRATVVVRDHGRGVAIADREAIFERFVQGSSPHGSGSGLGLAIGRETARRMGGDLVLEDQVEGGGAAFVLTLPAGDSGLG